METTFIVQEALFDLEAFAVLGERLQAGRFITNNLPLLLSVRRSGNGNMDWAKRLPSDGDVVETACFPGLEPNVVELAQALTCKVGEDQVRLDTDAVIPPTGPEPIHEFSVAKTSISKETNVMDAQRIEDAFDTSEHREKLSGRNLGAFVLDDFLMQWKGSSPERDSKADQAELPKEHTGVQSEHQTVLAPMT